MKKFFICTSIICLAGSYLLHHLFKYSTTIVLCHLLLMTILHVVVYALNLSISWVRPRWPRRILLNLVNFSFLAGLILFYLIILGSNGFWGKAISAGLLLSYLNAFDEFIGILPVEKWIPYACILLLLLLITGLFLLVRPRQAILHARYRPLVENKKMRLWMGISLLAIVLLAGLFSRPLLSAKRLLHFEGEPILEFCYGQMWDSGSFDYIYDTTRVKNGLKDKACIDAVTSEPEKKKDRIVIVILFDALRRDYLPIYGYPRSTTPFLDSLQSAGKIVAVKNMFSNTTTTLLGVAGLFSSKDWDNFSYNGLNLMKFLHKKGLSTYAFLTGQHRSWYGLASIYKNDCDLFYESTTSPTRMDFDDLTTLQKFRDTRLDANSFVYMHLLSTHNVGKKHEAFRKFLPDKMGIGTDKRTALVNNYDNGICQADYVIGEIFRKLKQDGVLERTSIYIVADHGELFGEDGRWSHSGSVQQNVIGVPLLIYDQDLTWYQNQEAASLKDVAPTIADRLGYTIPNCWEGTSLHQPVHDFSLKINSGSNECDLPFGVLTYRDSLYRLDLMNQQKEIKKTVTSKGGNEPWKVVPSS